MRMIECEDCQHIETVNDDEKNSACSQCNGKMGRPTTKTAEDMDVVGEAVGKHWIPVQRRAT